MEGRSGGKQFPNKFSKEKTNGSGGGSGNERKKKGNSKPYHV